MKDYPLPWISARGMPVLVYSENATNVGIIGNGGAIDGSAVPAFVASYSRDQDKFVPQVWIGLHSSKLSLGFPYTPVLTHSQSLSCSLSLSLSLLCGFPFSVSQSLSLSVCQFVSLSVCQFVSLSVCQFSVSPCLPLMLLSSLLSAEGKVMGIQIIQIALESVDLCWWSSTAVRMC